MNNNKQKQTKQEIGKRFSLDTYQEKPKKPAPPKKDDNSRRSRNDSKPSNN